MVVPFSSDNQDDDDIPVVDDSMLHPSVEFEAGMSWCPPVTIALFVACVIAFIFEITTGALQNVDRLEQMGALSRPLIEKGEVWRLLSSAFLHASGDHLIGNMLILFVLGMACEHAYGSSQYVFLFVVAALGGSCVSLLDGKPSVGASGAIFGLAGALIALFRRYRWKLHLRENRIGFVLAIWSAYQIASGWLNPQIDNFCHLGGFVTGLIVGALMPSAIFHDREEFGRRPTTILMGLLGFLSLASVSIWFVRRMIG